ncbi:MAG: DegV family EDD domain-containing protein [Lachnospiraceae bacterium]|nr:DegV family EDD domain-containing protein [Lachnospiraceae bacterium]
MTEPGALREIDDLGILKDWLNSITDLNKDRREREFLFLTPIILAVFLLITIMGFALSGLSPATLALGAGWLVTFALGAYSLKKKKLSGFASVFSGIIIFLMQPVFFYLGGGIFGGAPIAFVFCVIYLCTITKGLHRKVFLVMEILLIGFCFCYCGSHPEFFPSRSVGLAGLDMLLAVLLVSTMGMVMIQFELRSYERENLLAKEQREQILTMNRMQNRFFSAMSHEIRTPINTIIGLNEMNLKENLSEEALENSQHIQEASNLLLTLINDILDISRIESGEMTIVPNPYSTEKLLTEIVNMVRPRIREKGLEFKLDIEESLPRTLMGDDVRVRQVLINILNNAVKYTKEGSVTLSLQWEERQNGTASLIFAVMDTGTGIKKEDLPHLFTAYKRADEGKTRHIEGTGLGLSIVRQLLDLMGGKVTVDSIYGKGSTFTVDLPQEIVDPAGIGKISFAQKKPRSAEKGGGFEVPGARVLVVDDNEVNLMVAAKLLRDTKAKVESVTDGADCLNHTLNIHYDVIFMDHLMPGMDGIECLHAIRHQAGGRNTDTPVAVLTANAGSEYLDMYGREGFDDFILKPVTGSLLEGALRRLLPKELLPSGTEDTKADEGTRQDVTYRKHKRRFCITTESVADLPESLSRDSHIGVLPYDIVTPKGSFLDGIEIWTDGVLSFMEETGAKVEGCPPDVKRYEEFFSEQLKNAQQVIHITASRKLNNAYAHAAEAARSFGAVTIVDSGQMSGGMALLAVRAAELAEREINLNGLIEELESLKQRLDSSFVLGNMLYLSRSGRAPRRAMLMGRSFLLRPVLGINNGTIRPKRLSFGSRNRIWKKYISSALKDRQHIDRRMLFICHLGLNEKELSDIKEFAQSKVGFESVYIQKISPATASLYGSGTFGLLFAKERA